MDLGLYGRVLWRFRHIVAGGFVVGVLLSVFTVATINFSGFPHLVPRPAPIYQASADLFVTEPDFPWGSAVQTYTPSGQSGPAPTGDLGRLNSLANLYAQLANSDTIKALAARKSPPGGQITAAQKFYTNPAFYTSALPILTINGTATNPARAIATAQAGADALIGYLARHQRAADIPEAHRVVLQEIHRPARKTVTVVNPTKKTLPIAVFLTVMLAVVGLVFVLENMRPVPRTVVLRPEADPVAENARRSA